MTRWKWVHDVHSGRLTRVVDGVPQMAWEVWGDGRAHVVPLHGRPKTGPLPLATGNGDVHDGQRDGGSAFMVSARRCDGAALAMAVAREVASPGRCREDLAIPAEQGPAPFTVPEGDHEMRDDTDPEMTDPVQDDIAFEDDHPEAPIQDTEPDDDDEGAPAGDTEVGSDALETRVPRWMRLGDLELDYKHWKNPRSFTGLDDERMQHLADDIKAKTTQSLAEGNAIYAGVDEPLLVVQIQTSKTSVGHLILDGQRRYKGVLLAGLGKDAMVPVRDREPAPVQWSRELALRYLAEVHRVVALREGLSGYEISDSALQLSAGKGDDGKPLTMDQIGDIVGRSKGWVSRVIAARKAASPKLLERWRTGEITEEMFIDLATGVKDKTLQDATADEAVQKIQAGDKGGARALAKQQKELARQEARAKASDAKKAKAAKKAALAQARQERQDSQAATKAAKAAKGKGKKVAAPAIKGPQADLPLAKDKDEPPAVAKPKSLSPAVVEDVLETARRKPPVSDLAKGVILGIQVATGRLAFEDLPKPWQTYVHQTAGTKPAKHKRKR